jgi:hypothetical protein
MYSLAIPRGLRLLHPKVEVTGRCKTIAIYQCTRCYIPEDTESSTGLGGLWYRRGLCLVGRGSSVGIAISYELDGPGIESRGGLYFPARLDWTWGPLGLLYNGYRVLPRCKRPVCGIYLQTLSSAEVRKRGELCLYSHWALVACSRVNFTFCTFYCVCLQCLLACNRPVFYVCGHKQKRMHVLRT